MDPEVRKELDALRTEMQQGFDSLRAMTHEPGAARSGPVWKTVVLWLVLMVLFFSFYSIFSRQRANPDGGGAAKEPPGSVRP